MSQAGVLSRKQEYALAATTAVVTANAYYIHPIIGEVADSFAVSDARIGWVPAFNQIALAIGIFLLLPLGDRFSNKRLSILFVALQTLSMFGMAAADSFVVFTGFSTLLGFVTITPYLLPAFASKRVAPERLGQVTALLTVGVIFGILVARVGAGVVAEAYGWRSVYWIAAVLMLGACVMLPLAMRSEGHHPKPPAGSYGALLGSVFTITAAHREVMVSALIQALNFGTFIATWLAMALYLTSDAMGYGVDAVGYLAGVAIVSLLATPRIGRWADRVGPRKARLVAAIVQLAGISLFYPMSFSAWGLLVPLAIVNIVGPSVDVTGRMLFLSLEPAIRTRLTTSYIVLMFVGGGIGSIAGTAVYDYYGWIGTCVLIAAASLCVTVMSWASYARARRIAAA